MSKTDQNKTKEYIVNLADITESSSHFLDQIFDFNREFGIAIQVNQIDVKGCTAMITIPIGIVTIDDIARALEVAMERRNNISEMAIFTSPQFKFILDNILHTDIFPLGLPAKTLSVTVHYALINHEIISMWSNWANRLGRNIVSWRVEVID